MKLPAGEYDLTLVIDGVTESNPVNRQTIKFDYLGIHYEATDSRNNLNDQTKVGVRIYGTSAYADDFKLVE